jgi:hypothetical protein
MKVRKAVRIKVRIWSGFYGSKLKADPPHGLDIVCAPRILELLSKVADVLLEGTFRTVRRIGTDPVQKNASGDDPVGVFHEKLYNGILRSGQPDLLSAYGQTPGQGVYGQVTRSQGLSP